MDPTFSRRTTIFSGLITLILGLVWFLAVNGVVKANTDIFEPLLTIFGAVTGISGAVWFTSSRRDSTEPAESLEQRNRRVLIESVRRKWIEGVLKDALRDAQIQIDAKARPDQVSDAGQFMGYELPIEIMRRDGKTTEPLAHTAAMLRQVFRDTKGKLLILGAKGSGKTVLMLQLAEILLDEAETNNTPIPVVFNLSSWGNERKPLADWIAGELGRNYGVGKKLAAEFIGGDRLIFLLDGLDEVAEAYRDDCLHAINAFKTPIRQLVVCSRTEEYDDLVDKLDIESIGVELQPLSEERFEGLLRHYIPYSETVDKILATLQADDAVWQEANKPLFINILITTYKDGQPFKPEYVQGDTIRKIGSLVIEPYVRRQLQNTLVSNYPNDKVLRWLAFIGHNLKQRQKTIFYVEMFQRDWLPTKQSLRSFVWGISITFGLLLALIALLDGQETALIVAPLFAMSFASSDINLERRIRWNVWVILKSTWENRSSVSVRLVVMLFCVILGVGTMLQQQGLFGLLAGLVVGLLAGLVVGRVVALFVGLFVGLIESLSTGTSIEDRAGFNQGLSEALLVGLVIGLLVGLVIGLLVGLVIGLVFSVSAGLFSLFLTGLVTGPGSAIRHLVLRLLLYNLGFAPRRYDRFLLYVIDRRLMRRVVGSAIFIHRYFLDYFADLWAREYAPQYEENSRAPIGGFLSRSNK